MNSANNEPESNVLKKPTNTLVAGIIIHNKKLLLVCNSKEHFRDAKLPTRLEPPGGKVESNERLTQALLREFSEELISDTGELINIGVGKKLLETQTQSQEGTFTVHMFLCCLREQYNEILTNESTKLNGTKWASWQELIAWQQHPPKGYILVPNICSSLPVLQRYLT